MAPVALLTSSSKSHTPRVLQGEGIVMPQSQQQPAASTTSRILQALGLQDEDVAMQNNTVTIPPGKSYNITLADGTKVFMYAAVASPTLPCSAARSAGCILRARLISR